eukprot:gene33449-37798_t
MPSHDRSRNTHMPVADTNVSLQPALRLDGRFEQPAYQLGLLSFFHDAHAGLLQHATSLVPMACRKLTNTHNRGLDFYMKPASGKAGADQVDTVGAEAVHAPAQDLAGALRRVDGVAEQAETGCLHGLRQPGLKVLVVGITGDRAFELTAAESYVGPGAVVLEVTTGTSVDDPEGIRAVLSVPVQVGSESPILRCPDEPVRIAQGQSLDLDIASLCHVWTPDPDDVGGLDFDADWETSSDGLAIITPSGPAIEVAAAATADPGS